MTDKEYMKRVFQLANKGDSRVEPNPKVGCVIVKNGEIIGEGYHQKAGENHAEVNAIEDAINRGKDVEGATLYVNLEPCSHYGKTPPCAELIVKKKIKRVVIANIDPNPKVCGCGIEILKNNGIEVESGIFEDEGNFLNRVFFNSIKSPYPYVFLKAGISLDGKIQTKTGESQWITSQDSRSDVHRMRSEVGAIAVGIETVIKDNPLLNSRSDECENIDPVAVVFDSSLRIPLEAKILNRNSEKETVIFTSRPDHKKLKLLKDMPNTEIYEVADEEGRVSIEEALKILREKNIISLLIEGGGTLNDTFMRKGLIDELLLYLAPILIGGYAKSFIQGEGIAHLKDAQRFKLYETKEFGCDLFLRYLRQ